MNAPLLIAEKLEARALAANAVHAAYFERFGAPPCPEDRLYELDPFVRFELVCAIELKLGVAFRDEDIEFLETPPDLIERGAEILMRRCAR